MTTIAPSQNTINTLKSFGLEERVAKLYLSLLDLGQASVLQLAKKSGVERTVIYYLLKELRRYGLVKELYDKNNRLLLVPAPPERLLSIEEERAKEVKSLIPELKALHRDQTEKPKVQLFEGLEGIDTLYDDVLSTLKGVDPKHREMLTYSALDLITALPIRNQAAFREARGKHGIHIRVIAEDSDLAREFKSRDKQELRESRLLPEGVPTFRAAFVVYANKVAMYNLKGDISVLVIENKDLADLQRTVFELAWHALTPDL